MTDLEQRVGAAIKAALVEHDAIFETIYPQETEAAAKAAISACLTTPPHLPFSAVEKTDDPKPAVSNGQSGVTTPQPVETGLSNANGDVGQVCGAIQCRHCGADLMTSLTRCTSCGRDQ